MDNIEEAKKWFDAGNEFHVNGEYDKAIESYTKAIELKPDYADAYYKRGLVYSKMGEGKKATDDFGMAKKLNPDDE